MLRQSLTLVHGRPAVSRSFHSFSLLGERKETPLLLPAQCSFSTETTKRTKKIIVKGNSVELPPNLQLADKTVLEETPQLKRQPSVQDLFPLLNVPETIEVRKFRGEANQVISTTPLERTIFEVPIRGDVVHEYVRYIRNKRRQPKRTKRIGDIKGSNRKPWAQKKIGKTQVGNRRNSAWRGGQKAHGPVIRDYSIGMNKKARALAMMTILAAKFREGNLLVFDDVATETLKTKELHEALKIHGLDKTLTLIVNTFWPENFILASRNMQKLEHKTLRNLDGYEILRKEKLVFTQKAFEEVQKKLLYQYRQTGKAKALERNMNAYLDIVQKGKQLTAEAETKAL